MDVKLTDVWKVRIQEYHPQSIVWEYDPDKPSKLLSWASEFTEITYLGIPYHIPNRIDGKPTIRKASTRELGGIK